MATTTSSASTNPLNSSQLIQRRANAARNWKAPGEYTPKSLISSRWGPSIIDDTFLTFAHANAKLDRRVVSLVEEIAKLILAGQLNAGDITAQVESRHAIADIATIESQFGAIENGESTFTNLYLVNRHLPYYWRKAFTTVTPLLGAGKDDPAYKPICGFIENVFREANELRLRL